MSGVNVLTLIELSKNTQNCDFVFHFISVNIALRIGTMKKL